MLVPAVRGPERACSWSHEQRLLLVAASGGCYWHTFICICQPICHMGDSNQEQAVPVRDEPGLGFLSVQAFLGIVHEKVLP